MHLHLVFVCACYALRSNSLGFISMEKLIIGNDDGVRLLDSPSTSPYLLEALSLFSGLLRYSKYCRSILSHSFYFYHSCGALSYKVTYVRRYTAYNVIWCCHFSSSHRVRNIVTKKKCGTPTVALSQTLLSIARFREQDKKNNEMCMKIVAPWKIYHPSRTYMDTTLPTDMWTHKKRIIKNFHVASLHFFRLRCSPAVSWSSWSLKCGTWHNNGHHRRCT